MDGVIIKLLALPMHILIADFIFIFRILLSDSSGFSISRDFMANIRVIKIFDIDKVHIIFGVIQSKVEVFISIFFLGGFDRDEAIFLVEEVEGFSGVAIRVDHGQTHPGVIDAVVTDVIAVDDGIFHEVFVFSSDDVNFIIGTGDAGGEAKFRDFLAFEADFLPAFVRGGGVKADDTVEVLIVPEVVTEHQVDFGVILHESRVVTTREVELVQGLPSALSRYFQILIQLHHFSPGRGQT